MFLVEVTCVNRLQMPPEKENLVSQEKALLLKEVSKF